MRHAVEKHFRREREKAAASFRPLTTVFIEQDIGKAAHITRVMPLFLTLRDEDGKPLVTAMLPPGGRADRTVACIIVGPANADPYAKHADAIAALGAPFRYHARSGRLLSVSALMPQKEGDPWPYTLEQFAADCHAALKPIPAPAGRREGPRPGQPGAEGPGVRRHQHPGGHAGAECAVRGPGLRLRHPGARLCRAEGQQAARPWPVLGDLRPGGRRDDHDRLGVPGAPDRDHAGQGGARRATTS